MLKSSSTKRNDSDTNHGKKLYSGLQNLIDESADSKLNWNGIILKFNCPCGFILTTYLPYLQLSSVCACYITLKKDNFFVFRVVYKTEKSKVMVKILVTTNAESLFNTMRRHSRPSFLSAVFAARAVLEWPSRPLAKPPIGRVWERGIRRSEVLYLRNQYVTNSVGCTRESTTFWPLSWRISLSIRVQTTVKHYQFIKSQ